MAFVFTLYWVLIFYFTVTITADTKQESLFLYQEVAKHLRPHTLRAKFGVDKVRNAIHCTDLPDDAGLEVRWRYFLFVQSSLA